MVKTFHTHKNGRKTYSTGECINCNVPTFSYAKRCRPCSFKKRTKHEYFSICSECGSQKSRGFKNRCKPCGYRSKYKNVLERLERYTKKGDTCWTWIGQNNGTGYGVITFRGKASYVHRISYEFHFGRIPDGINVLHKCDTRNCWRPEHLFLGTQMENVQDAIKKGRHVRGEKQGQHKLTEKKVIEMRKLYIPRKFGSPKLAKMFGVSSCTALRIVRGDSWKHVN